MRILQRYGAIIRVASPETFLPHEVKQFNLQLFSEVEKALPGSDVVYALRVQQERGSMSYIPSLREYSKAFGINPSRFAMANSDAILMHPGPIVRDIDIYTPLVSHERCRILTQIENGLAIRKAILWLLTDRRDNKQKPYEIV